MRNLLNFLYKTSGALAACSLVAIMLLVIAQIVARQFNSHIPSSGDIIGFLVVWASFLGLAYTMHHNHHIRVELFVSRLSHSNRRWLDVVVGLCAFVLVAVFCYFVIALIMESYQYDDQTDGEISMPLWLMQLPMGVGCVLFALSILDFCYQVAAGVAQADHIEEIIE